MAVAALLGTDAGCAPPTPDPGAVIADAVAAGLPSLRPRVLATIDHDTSAWTEGLEIADGVLYESTGLPGHSQLRALDPRTGRVRSATSLPSSWYGEGITVLDGRIWQLTYRDHVALRWDRGSLSAESTPASTVRYPGEGWGLCHTGNGQLVASDGSDRLRLLSPNDLTQLGSVLVRVGGRPLTGLNELECGSGAVWANVYQTDWLARINLANGSVTEVVDASELLPRSRRPDGDVLNGIASVPGTDQFLLTGKFWPSMFLVRFGP
jgi:glutaminyl-peptide cyclotransferase